MAEAFCPDIDNFFQTEANRIGYTPSYIPWTATPWEGNDIVPKIQWEDGMGENPNVLIYDRVTPLNGPIEFQTVSFNNGEGAGPCDPPTSTLYPATRRLAFELKGAALNSDWVCLDSARMTYNLAQQASNVLRQMDQNVKNAWQNQRRDQFTAVASNKAIADAAMTTNPTVFATGTIGQLRREMLDYWYDSLVANGANINNKLASTEYNQPLLPLILSREAQATLVNNDTTINNIRWSNNQNDRLLGPRGSFVNLDGFKMMIDIQAARWNLVGGQWVRVPFYSTVTTAGQASIVNPAYATAEYEDLYIGSPEVVQFAIPSPTTNSGPMSFAAQNYLGDVRWINEYDQQCNVDRNKGFFRARMTYGSKPGIPEFGVTLRFRRCAQSWEVDSTCS